MNITVYKGMTIGLDTDCVIYADHVASHSVNEDYERAVFESVCPYRIDRYDGVYESQRTQDGWNMWIYRARLREIKR